MKKIYTLTGLLRVLKPLRKRKKIVFTNGCFDILHTGHIRYLKKAKSLGDILVIGLNTDKSVRKIKGKSRPIIPEGERAELLEALSFVDYIVLFSDPTPLQLIEKIKPDFLVKGADWKKGEIVGEEVLKQYGGKVRRITLTKGKSTTNIIEKVLKLNK